MCGIWAVFGLKEGVCPDCTKCFSAICHRGPDAWRLEQVARLPTALLGFHRLTIIDGLYGMQPMKIHKYPDTNLICNGEIYNCHLLKEQYTFPYETDCDVESIIHLYQTEGIEKTVRNLDGVFAFCIVDAVKKKIYIARDPYGVRPLFTLVGQDGFLGVCSEAKGLMNLKEKFAHNSTLGQFPPGNYQVWNILPTGKVELELTKCYFKPGDLTHSDPFVKDDVLSQMTVSEKTAHLLKEACRKRMMSDRRIGCLLSGGLDSSIIAGLIVKLAMEIKLPYPIQTFSIGMADSPDLHHALTVARHLGTEHHEVTFDESDVKSCLDKLIYHIESYDITTVRASIPMYLLANYIKENTDTTVIFSGEGADEVAQGYIYFRDAPSADAAHDESVRLLSDIYLYDGLRADRTTSAYSLELRVPFLDHQFTHHYLNINPKLRQPHEKIEKYLLRHSFTMTDFLPRVILWRHKEAFSDGVTCVNKPFYETIAGVIAEQYPKEELEFQGLKPLTNEAKYYRYVFEKSFPGEHHLTPYYWMPKWTTATDPSARFITHYNG